MASMVVGGLFNAFAFAGAGFLFSKLNHSGYKDEIKRHNLALEHLSKAKQEWYEEEVSIKNKIEEKRHQLVEANKDINITNAALNALDHLNRIMEKRSLEREPTLNDYYKPSEEMEAYKVLTMAAVGLGGGLAGYKVYKAVKRSKRK